MPGTFVNLENTISSKAKQICAVTHISIWLIDMPYFNAEPAPFL